ncbi:MAG TPA: hypothetical protein VGK89_10160, partial [Candidatus Eisenbacteria bacterium]
MSKDPQSSEGRRVLGPVLAMERPGPALSRFTLRLSALAALAAAALLASSVTPSAADPDLPGPSANLQVVKAGSLVIPMDVAHQGTPAPFNMKAYGLANVLLQNNIPLKWVIKAGKAKDAIDFTATAARIRPTAIAAASQDFRAGPLIIAKAYAASAISRIDAFGGGVAVYQLTQDVLVDVRHELRFKPRILVNTVNATIHTDILDEAGITNYLVAGSFTILPGSCYTFASEPHNASNAGVQYVRSFVQTGGNFLGQCLSVLTYENDATNGHLMSTLGFTSNNNNNTINYPSPDLPFVQFEGTISPSIGGSERDWRLATGSAFQSGGHSLATDIGISPTTYCATAAKLYSGGVGGMLFYLGGHSYSSNSDVTEFNGRRAYLNAVLTPCTRPGSCGLDIQVNLPDLTLLKSHAGTIFVGDSVNFTINVTDSATTATVDTFTVRDTLPAGLAFVSGSGSGWSFSVSGQVVTATHPGVLAGLAISSFTLRAHATAPAGTFLTNWAHVEGGGDETPLNNSDYDTLTVFAHTPDLAVQKRHTVPFAQGTNRTYTLVMRNVGLGPTTGVITVKDTLPTGLTYVSSAGTGWSFSTSGQIVTATNPGPVAGGDSTIFTVTVAVGAAAVPQVVNSGTVTTVGDPNVANDVGRDTTAVTGLPDLALDKRHTGSFTDGANGTYTFVVRNLGPSSTSGASTVVDTLPAGLAYVSGSGTGWTFSSSGSIVTATHSGAIVAGDSSIFTLTVSVGPAAVPAVINTAVASTAGDSDPSNDRDVDPTTVIGAPDLAMAKRHTVAFVDGSPASYTLVVTNVGTAVTTGGITVKDTLPAGLLYSSASGTGWSFSESGGIVTATHPGPVAIGDSLVFTLDVDVRPAAVPGVINSATASTAGDPYPANDRASDPTVVQGVPDLALDKRHIFVFVDGYDFDFTMVVSNVGTGPTTGVITVLDTLPNGLLYSSASGAGWSFSESGGIVTATHPGALATGDSLVFTLTVSVRPAAVPSATNVAGVSTVGDPYLGNNHDTDVVSPVDGSPDIALAKRHTGDFTDGANGTYTMVVTSVGTAPTVGPITVRDTLPAGLAYVSGAGAGWSFSESGGIVTATYAGQLLIGDSLVFTITVLPGPAAVPGVTNSATASTLGDPYPLNDTATDPTVVLGAPDLAMAKRHTAQFVDGADGTYTMVVTNVGTAATTGAITVTDTLPTGLVYVSAAGAGWSFSESGGIVTGSHAGPVAIGDSLVFTLTVGARPASVPAVTNSVTVSTPGDPYPANDTATDPTTVLGAPDVAMDKRHTAQFVDGFNGVYTMVVTNVGTAATTGATTVKDTLPTGLSYVSGSGAGWSFSQSGGIVTATHAGSVAAGDSSIFTLTVAVAPSAVPGVINSATASTAGDPYPDNDRDSDPTAVGAVPDLALSKRHTAQFVDGSNGTYTLVATNVGTAATTGAITVLDTLPTGLTYVSGAGAGWGFSESGGIVTASHAGPIAVNDSLVFTLTVNASPAAVPAVINAATVSTAGDPYPGNDRATDPTDVAGAPDLAMAKRHTGSFADGADSTYTLSVTNVGTAATTGAITVLDTLPSGLSYVSGAGAGWSFSESAGIVTASHAGPIAIGDSLVFALTVNVGPAAFPAVTNAATVSTPGDPYPANDRATDPTDVTGAPDLAMAKRHTAAFVDGANGTYTLVVTNVGTSTTTGAITVLDTLPTGLAYVSGAGAGWSFAESGGIVTASHAGPIAAGDSLVYTLTVNVSPPAFPAVINAATVSTAGDPYAANDRATDPTAITGAPDLAMAKRHTDVFVDGANASYTLVVTNVGTASTTGAITVLDTLPTGLSYVSGAGAGWGFSESGGIVTASNAGPIAAGDSLVYTLTVNVSPPAVPAVINSATVSTAGDPYAANDRATDPTDVTGAPDLAMAKRHTAAFVDGANGTYTLVVTNVGTAATTGTITVLDTLPAGLSFYGASGASWSISESGGIVTATSAGPIAVGDSLVISLSAVVSPAAVPAVINSATVSTVGDPYPANDRASDPTTVTGAPDLAMAKRHTAQFVDGQNGTYTLVVTNVGTSTTSGGITVTDPLPTGMSYVSGAGSGWSFSELNGFVTATHPGPLAVGDSLVFTITVTAGKDAVPSVINSATVNTAGDPYAANDTATDPTDVTGAPDLAMAKHHTVPFVDGADGTYTLVVSNVGTAVTTGAITVLDTLPTGLSYVSGAGAGWSFSESGGIVTASHAGPIAVGDSLVYTLTVNVSPPAVPIVINSATVSTAGDPYAANDRASDPTLVGAVPDLAMDKRHTDLFADGASASYTLVVTNVGTGPTTGAITVLDTLPAGLTYVSGAGAGWSFGTTGQVVTASHSGPVAVGDSLIFTLTVNVSQAAVPGVVNLATVSTPGDPYAANDSDADPTDVSGAPDLALDKRHTAQFVDGANGTYTLVVTNVGTTLSTGAITVSDTLPTGLSYVSGAGAGWSFGAAGQIVTATHGGTLAVGDSLVFTLTVNVSPAAFPAVTNVATVSVAGDPYLANNTDSDPTDVAGAPDLAMDKRHTAAFVDGANGTYTMVVTNVGTAATTGAITVSDTLPTGLSYVSGAGAGWSFSSSGQIVTASHSGPIAVSDSLVFTLTVNASPAAFPAVTNSATVNTAGDPYAANNTDSDPTVVGGAPDLAMDKRHTVPFVDGANGTYTLVVTNVGTAVTTGAITVSDTLPTGLSYVSGAGAGWSFSAAGQIVTASHAGPVAVGDSLVLALTVFVSPAAVPGVTNSATVNTAGDPYAANDTDSDPTAVGAVPDLALQKRHTAGFVDGSNGTYTLVVTNVGTGSTTGAIT